MFVVLIIKNTLFKANGNGNGKGHVFGRQLLKTTKLNEAFVNNTSQYYYNI